METVPDPVPPEGGVVLRVRSTGICRSDWHGWMGHDPDISLPHVPGHELAGEIVEVGKGLRGWNRGDRVTLPFVCGCGQCAPCLSGNQQVCDAQFQPGFTHWGSFAEYVAIHHAADNLVRLPDAMPYTVAASLGCRFTTAFRALVHQGKLAPGQWLAVHGCGGVGLSAVMIGNALGVRIVAVDIQEENLHLAQALGAEVLIRGDKEQVVPAIRSCTHGGAHVSVDALGHAETCYQSIACLRRQGKHVQVGLMAGPHADPRIPMGQVIAQELEILGSHGMQAHRYPEIWNLWEKGLLPLQQLIGRTLSLEAGCQALMEMDTFSTPGISVIDRFVS